VQESLSDQIELFAMVDIHTHILPGVDDGAKDWRVTLEMCQQALVVGVTHIVATPHANFRYRYSRESHLHLLDELRVKAPALQFSLGCELQLSGQNVEEFVRNPGRYTINDSPYVLVEFVDISPALRMLDPIVALLGAGVVPIVAHPERNATLLNHMEVVETLVAMGCLVQVTASSLTGYWGGRAKQMALRLIKNGLAHFLASDAHNATTRAVGVSAGLWAAARVIGEAEAMKLVWDNPMKLVGGSNSCPHTASLGE
jgi:protein-tyrosine phosphatase